MDRLYLQIGQSPRFQCYPLGYAESAIVATKERNQVFYRRRFEGELIFTGCDFSKIAEIELSENRCIDILFTIERGIETYWSGYFTASMCEFDFNLKTASVVPQPKDRYEPFIRGMEEEINITELDSIPVTSVSMDMTYTHCKDWVVVMKAIVAKIDPNIGFVSDFFTNDNNPVLRDVNFYNRVAIAQKSDVKRPDSTEPARVGNMSFELMTGLLRDMFNVYWDISESGEFRVEHISEFYKTGANIDLRGEQGEAGTLKYKYDSMNIPVIEKIFLEGSDDDFAGVPIRYNPKCALGDGTEVKYDVCNDLRDIRFGVSDIADSGFVFFACVEQSGGWICPDMTLPISGFIRPNGFMAMSVLMDWFHRHNRWLMKGELNGRETDFLSAKATILQTINLPTCISLPLNRNYETSLTDIIDMESRIRELRIKQDGSNVIQLEYYPEKNYDTPALEKNINIQYTRVRVSPLILQETIMITLSYPAPFDGFAIGYDLNYLVEDWDEGMQDWVENEVCILDGTLRFDKGELISDNSIILKIENNQHRRVGNWIKGFAYADGYQVKGYSVTIDDNIIC